MILDGTKYPEGWVSWGKEAAATEVPGAKNFLNYAASKGVTIFYVTNRVVELKEATKKESNQPWYALGSNNRYCFNARRK
jgi:predicted secreted acid phosphatase